MSNKTFIRGNESPIESCSKKNHQFHLNYATEHTPSPGGEGQGEALL